MNKNPDKGNASKDKAKTEEVADKDKVTEEESAENKEKGKNRGDKDDAVLGDLNRDPKKDKK